MSFMKRMHRLVVRGDPPRWMRENNLPSLVWKLIRKWLNVAVIPVIPLNGLRVCLYRCLGFKIGKKVFIGMRCYMDDMHPSRTVIEDNVTVSYSVVFAAHGPGMIHEAPRIILRQGAYIGTRATILGGADVGRWAMVGAASLVNKAIPPFTVAYGVPAKVMRTVPLPDTTHYEMYMREQGMDAENSGGGTSDDEGCSGTAPEEPQKEPPAGAPPHD